MDGLFIKNLQKAIAKRFVWWYNMSVAVCENLFGKEQSRGFLPGAAYRMRQIRQTELRGETMKVFEKIFGSYSDREIKRVVPIAKKVLTYEDEYANLSDAELRAKTDEFKQRLAAGENDGRHPAGGICHSA